MSNLTGYINNYEEAILLIHAIRLECFPLLKERLSIEDREKIESGDIFCFIENENGMKRWTDGRIWSPSKICGEFLVYQEVPRHLSKNSIKKRKGNEVILSNGATNLVRKEDIIDRTTLHKKTISVRLNNTTYHIISYYRPIFANYSLFDIPFFQRLSDAINLYPMLKDDNFIKENLNTDPNFYERYNIQKDFKKIVMEDGKRAMLEKIAVEVLDLLSKKKDVRNTKNKM